MGIIEKVAKAWGKFQQKAEEQAEKAEQMEERAKKAKAEGADYRSVEEMPPKQQEILEKVMFPDEEFVMSIRLKGARNPPYLTVTDKRLLETTPKTTGYESKTFDLDKVSKIEYEEGLTKGTLTITGTDIHEEYTLKKKYHENLDEFQQEVYSRT